MSKYLYGEAVLIMTLKKIPEDARRVWVPACLERRLGSLYLVGEVDHAVLKGDLARACELLRQEIMEYFDTSLDNAESEGFRMDRETHRKYRDTLTAQTAEDLLFERYPLYFEDTRNIRALVEVSTRPTTFSA